MSKRAKSSEPHPIIEAARKKQFAVVLQLLRDRSTKADRATLQEGFVRCILSRDLKLVDEFLHRGVSIDARWNGYTALSTVAGFANARFVKALLERGADPNVTGFDGATPIIACAKVGTEWEDPEIRRHSVTVGKALLNAGANVDWADDFGNTALDYTYQSKWEEMAKLLYSHSATPSKCANDGAMLLFWAVSQPGSTRLLEMYIKNNGSVELEIASGVTALLHAKKAGWTDKVKLLETVGRH